MDETYAVTTAADTTADTGGGVGKAVVLVAAGGVGGFLLGAGAEHLRNREERRQMTETLAAAADGLKRVNDRLAALEAAAEKAAAEQE